MHTDLPWTGLPRSFLRCSGTECEHPRAGLGLADSQKELGNHSIGLGWPCTTPGAIVPCIQHKPCGGTQYAPALVSSPRRIELNRMFQVMCGTPPTLLSFTLAGILSKRLED